MTRIPDAEKVAVSSEMEEASRAGLVDGLVLVGAPEALPELTVVRPVVEDDGISWPAELGALLSARQGSVVGFASADPRLAAELAGAYASWRGDRGGDSVLIDASLERPVIDRPLMEDDYEGYVDAVLYGVSAQAVARRTLARGVRVVTAGSRPLTIGRALDPGRLREFVRAVEADLAIIVLPLKYEHLVAEALDAAVIIDEDEQNLLRAARAARESGTTRVVCVLQVPRAPAVEEPAAREEAALPVTPEEATPSADREEAAGPTTPEEAVRSADSEATARPAEREEAPQPAARDEAAEPRSVAHEGPSPFLDEGTPTPFADDEQPLVIAASRRPARRSYRRPVTAVVILLVAVVVIVWGWLGPALRNESGPLWRRPAEQADRSAALGTGHERPAVAEEATEAESSDETAADMADEGSSGAGEGRAGDRGGASGGVGEDSPDGGDVAGTRVVAQEGPAPDEETSPAIVIDPASPLFGPGGPYVIYLSSQRLWSAAEVDVEQARRTGLLAEIIDADVPGSGMWHRVALVGGYPTLAEARNTLDIIKELGYEGAWIARAPRDE